jgi:SAM-dependent methyltransferase
LAATAAEQYVRRVTFDVTADAYTRFMGRYAGPLAVRFVDLADVRAGQRALDVGCGPGTSTAPLVARLGAASVSAIDPSPSFVVAARARFPDVDVQSGVAEELPFDDDLFDAALAQLVVQFMADPVAGLTEMARVTRPGGVVAACVWDHAGGGGPLSVFWAAVRDTDPDAPGEADLPGAREGQLAELCAAAGLRDIEAATLTVRAPFDGTDEWWEPFTLGVGPAGAYVAGLDEARRDLLRDACARRLPTGSFEVSATAWCVRSRV